MSDLKYVKRVNSTNELLWKGIREKSVSEGFVFYTDFQSAGKGQIGNSWESQFGKNLLFSIALFPRQIPIDEQFIISQFVSMAIKRTLDKYTDNKSIKWPNDIYWKDKKLGGILIENSLQGREIKAVVIGIGLNVNQIEFKSDAPNPVSLAQILNKTIARKKLLIDIRQNILQLYQDLDIYKIRTEYFKSLYRNTGFYTFK
jgi:BirA family biotin operon repressor/biotin-[acetyl-CoA-carboxylase] ligase